MRIGVVTGSFDPITNGHLDIIERASKFFDKLYVVAFINEKKHYLFSEEARLEMMKLATSHIKNVKCDFSSCFACDYCLKVSANCMIRGIRDYKDYIYEADLARQNMAFKGIETVFLLSRNDIKSSVIRNKLI